MMNLRLMEIKKINFVNLCPLYKFEVIVRKVPNANIIDLLFTLILYDISISMQMYVCVCVCMYSKRPIAVLAKLLSVKSIFLSPITSIRKLSRAFTPL